MQCRIGVQERRRRRRTERLAGGWMRRCHVRAVHAARVTGSGLMLRGAPVFGQVTLTPDSGQGPGGAQLQQLVNWGAGMALIVCVGAMVFHAVRWGWGSQQHNMAKVQDGKEGVGRAALVGGVIAASAALINFAVGLGGQVQ